MAMQAKLERSWDGIDLRVLVSPPLNGRQVNIKSIPSIEILHQCITAHSTLQCNHTVHPVSVNYRLAVKVKVKVESSALRDI